MKRINGTITQHIDSLGKPGKGFAYSQCAEGRLQPTLLNNKTGQQKYHYPDNIFQRDQSPYFSKSNSKSLLLIHTSSPLSAPLCSI